eukprot:TRINITY_DN4402_c0_g1_i1.p1 TRINITY_DN4402_c0_g1~~TRINITY_DN4402_c0_g1_i1.p1  ORF type:complete len:595 (-),score=230.19 TRINITY_DN4402_c0_g1_i1:192-1976(-)
MQEECTLQLEQQKLHLAVLSVNNRENTLKQVLRTKEDGLKEQTRRELQRVLKSQNLSKRQRAKLNDEVEIQVDHIIHLATLQWNSFLVQKREQKQMELKIQQEENLRLQQAAEVQVEEKSRRQESVLTETTRKEEDHVISQVQHSAEEKRKLEICKQIEVEKMESIRRAEKAEMELEKMRSQAELVPEATRLQAELEANEVRERSLREAEEARREVEGLRKKMEKENEKRREKEKNEAQIATRKKEEEEKKKREEGKRGDEEKRKEREEGEEESKRKEEKREEERKRREEEERRREEGERKRLEEKKKKQKQEKELKSLLETIGGLQPQERTTPKSQRRGSSMTNTSPLPTVLVNQQTTTFPQLDFEALLNQFSIPELESPTRLDSVNNDSQSKSKTGSTKTEGKRKKQTIPKTKKYPLPQPQEQQIPPTSPHQQQQATPSSPQQQQLSSPSPQPQQTLARISSSISSPSLSLSPKLQKVKSTKTESAEKMNSLPLLLEKATSTPNLPSPGKKDFASTRRSALELSPDTDFADIISALDMLSQDGSLELELSHATSKYLPKPRASKSSGTPKNETRDDNQITIDRLLKQLDNGW